jgi:hypothetical protein
MHRKEQDGARQRTSRKKLLINLSVYYLNFGKPVKNKFN